MKKFTLLMFAIAGCLTFASCSDDDGAVNMNTDYQASIGTYTLTAVNVEGSTTNLITTGCWSGELELGSDRIYKMRLQGEVPTDDCAVIPTSGTWIRNGNMVKLLLAGNGNPNVIPLTVSSDDSTLSRDYNPDAPGDLILTWTRD
jgi:hypothetical protein